MSDSNSGCDTSTLKTESTFTDDDNSLLAGIINESESESHESTFSRIEGINHIIKDLTTIDDAENTVQIDTNMHCDVNDCKLAIGTCIMKVEGERCVCEQISKVVGDVYDLTAIEDINISSLSINSSSCSPKDCCGGSCGGSKVTNDDGPEIEYKADGSVKIKEFLDIDVLNDKKYDVKSEIKFVPYNSCKAVLGNCIVSGNGTIGDGCLCAKMAIDEQVTAQEIDDITPQPEGNNSLVM